MALQMGFRLALPSGTVIGKPDLGLVRDSNPVPLSLRDSSQRGVFDLCIEALSTEKPGHVHRDLVVKKAAHAAGGVREYYILHRERENLAFHGRTDAGTYAPLPTTGPSDRPVVSSQVLPGLRFRIDDLTLRPDLDGMRRDVLQAHFVVPEWTQAEQARDIAEQGRKRAEQALDEAERERDAALALQRRETEALEALEAEIARLRKGGDREGA